MNIIAAKGRSENSATSHADEELAPFLSTVRAGADSGSVQAPHECQQHLENDNQPQAPLHGDQNSRPPSLIERIAIPLTHQQVVVIYLTLCTGIFALLVYLNGFSAAVHPAAVSLSLASDASDPTFLRCNCKARESSTLPCFRLTLWFRLLSQLLQHILGSAWLWDEWCGLPAVQLHIVATDSLSFSGEQSVGVLSPSSRPSFSL